MEARDKIQATVTTCPGKAQAQIVTHSVIPGPGHPSFSHGCSQAPEARATVLTMKWVLHVILVNRRLSGSV